MVSRNALAGAWHDLREVLSISFPIIVAMASHQFMGFVDTYVLGHYDPTAAAAVAASSGMAFTIMALIFGTANCTSTFVSQSFGRGDLADCGRYTWQGIHFGFVVQALMLPVLFTPGPLAAVVGIFGHEPALQDMERSYLNIRLFHMLGSASYASLTSFFQGIGRPRVPMVAALVANVFNAALDYVLVFGALGFPEMGVRGAALATTISSYFQSGILLGWFLSRHYAERYATRRSWGFDWGRLRRLLAIGLPAGLSFMLNVASWTIFTNVLIGKLGKEMLAANGFAHQIVGLSFMPALGVHKGVSVLVGQYIGRRNVPAAKRRAYVAVALTVAYMGCMGLVFFLFGGPLIRVFLAHPSQHPAIVTAGRHMLMLAALFQVFDALGIVCVGALRGAGDTRVPALASILLSWGLMLPLGYILTFTLELGYVGAWLAAAVHVAFYGTFMLWRFASDAWRKIDIFE